MDNQQKGGTPYDGNSSKFTGDVPQSGMVQDDEKGGQKPSRPPTGNGSQNGSDPENTDAATTDENPNANR